MKFHVFVWLFWVAFGMIPFESVALAEQSLYQGRGKRDPFVQLVGSGTKQMTGGLLAVESPDELVVDGVVLDADPSKSVVIANGTVLRMGEEVGNVKLLKINAESALFSVNGVEGEKALYQEVTKSEVKAGA